MLASALPFVTDSACDSWTGNQGTARGNLLFVDNAVLLASLDRDLHHTLVCCEVVVMVIGTKSIAILHSAWKAIGSLPLCWESVTREFKNLRFLFMREGKMGHDMNRRTGLTSALTHLAVVVKRERSHIGCHLVMYHFTKFRNEPRTVWATAFALSAVLSVTRVSCTLTMYLLYGRVLKLILILTDVILSMKQNVLGCVFMRVYIQNPNGAKSAEMLSKKTNQHAAVPNVFIYSYYTDVCSIFCVHNIINKGSVTEAGGMRRKQQTVCDKQNTIKLSECGSLCALVYRLDRTDFFTGDRQFTLLNQLEIDETMSIPLPHLRNAVTKIKLQLVHWGELITSLKCRGLTKKIDDK